MEIRCSVFIFVNPFAGHTPGGRNFIALIRDPFHQICVLRLRLKKILAESREGTAGGRLAMMGRNYCCSVSDMVANPAYITTKGGW